MRPESELRSLIQSSQKEGFQALFMQYYSYVYAIVWDYIRSAGTHEDAEECVNDIFIDIFQHFDRIENGKLQSYIGTVAKRRSINYFYRLTARPLSVSIDEQMSESSVSNESVEQEYDKAALRQVLLDAQTVGMKQPAVRKRLSRAIKRLRELLEKEGYTMNGGEED